MPQTQLPSAAGSTPAVRASAALAFLAPPPLIAGEDHAAYDDLLARISAALQPSDILEDIWVRDVVDMVWDALRLRRLKTQLLTASAHEGMQPSCGGFSTGNSRSRSRRCGRCARSRRW
jgi:hypothetical protein